MASLSSRMIDPDSGSNDRVPSLGRMAGSAALVWGGVALAGLAIGAVFGAPVVGLVWGAVGVPVVLIAAGVGAVTSAVVGAVAGVAVFCAYAFCAGLLNWGLHKARILGPNTQLVRPGKGYEPHVMGLAVGLVVGGIGSLIGSAYGVNKAIHTVVKPVTPPAPMVVSFLSQQRQR